jgi:hypothetical protein
MASLNSVFVLLCIELLCTGDDGVRVLNGIKTTERVINCIRRPWSYYCQLIAIILLKQYCVCLLKIVGLLLRNLLFSWSRNLVDCVFKLYQ